MRNRLHFNRAWGKLLLILFGTWTAGYALIAGLLALSVLDSENVLYVATGGVRNVSIPIVAAGVERGIPLGLMFFAINFSVSAVFVLLLVAAPLLDPDAKREFPSLLRRILTRTDPADRLLYRVFGLLPSFRRLGHDDLRPLTVWLNVAPPSAMILLGIELGAVTAAVQARFGSFPVAAAMLVPHCVLELPAICLAGSLPFGAYQALREAIEGGSVAEVFRKVRETIRSAEVRIRMLVIPALLVIAGLVESTVTPVVVAWAAGRL